MKTNEEINFVRSNVYIKRQKFLYFSPQFVVERS